MTVIKGVKRVKISKLDFDTSKGKGEVKTGGIITEGKSPCCGAGIRYTRGIVSAVCSKCGRGIPSLPLFK